MATRPPMHMLIPLQFKKCERIEKWVMELPNAPSEYVCMRAHPVRPSVSVYHDWLHEHSCRALMLLQRLDYFDLRYRKLGFHYHSLPLTHRHGTPALLPLIRARVAQQFESDTPRSSNTFFSLWFRVKKIVQEITFELLKNESVDDISALQDCNAKTGPALEQADTIIQSIAQSIRNMETIINHFKAPKIQPVDLTVKHSKEGSLCRRWMQTFGELEYLANSNVLIAEIAEDIIELAVKDELPQCDYWSDFVRQWRETWNRENAERRG
ncbi:hypothetical protein B0J11DRAFT_602902 [Dendryphion nanum]|uniref:Uncharacterized protein n=1 Tax=Dendryphion nanum TaxID=256645 RepID=A0A9P9E5Y8_9PLEO|nr:hypothetical protein B0J11DRAFT_602902 [Dendryphion nanum]